MSGTEANKACPWHGDNDDLALESNGSGVFWVVCNRGKCGCEGPYAHSPDEAWEKWNTRASPPSPAEVEWQSIETAPKDGTAIMLAGPWQGGFRRFIGRWGEHGWLEGEGGNGYYFPMHMQDFFAHWTPLPKPPTLSAGGRT